MAGLSGLSGLSGLASVAGGTAAPSTLLDQLVSYWKMDEASGSRVDVVSAENLTDVNTVTQVAGKIGNAAEFVAGNSEALTHASDANLRTGPINFTFAGWFQLKNTGSNNTILSKDDGATNREYGLYTDSSSGSKPTFYIFDPGDSFRSVPWSANSLVDTWYHLLVWHENGVGLGVTVNNGTPVLLAMTGGVKLAAAGFQFGLGNMWLDEWGFWKRLLTAPEKAALYNAGAGITHPFVGA